MHNHVALYALDDAALAAAEPDLILTQELCRVCAVGYREVNEVARRLDGDITVISLEPVSVEGILNSIQAVGAMTEAEDAALDVVEDLRERLQAVDGDRRRAPRPRVRPAARRRDRVAGPAVRRRPLGPRAGPPRRRLGAARRGGRPVRRDDLGRARRGRPGDPRPHALRVRARATRSPSGRGRRGPTGWAELRAVREDRVFAVDGSGAVLAARPADHRRHRGARRADRPGRVRRHVAARTPGPASADADAASCPRAVPRHRSTACGAARAWTTRGPDDLEGWAQLCSTCLGKAGDNPFLRGAAAHRRSRRRGRPRAAGAARPPRGRRRDDGRAPPRRRHPRPARRHAPRRALAARAAPTFPDDWFLRRGEFERGALHDTAWEAELDVVDPLARRPAAGAAGSRSRPRAIGFFSPLLAGQGRAPRDRPRRRRARPRARPARRPPAARAPPRRRPVGRPPRRTGPADGAVAASSLGRVRGAGLDRPLAVAARPAPARRPPGAHRPAARPGRRPAGGHRRGRGTSPALLEARAPRAGFRARAHADGRFFVLIAAEAG